MRERVSIAPLQSHEEVSLILTIKAECTELKNLLEVTHLVSGGFGI